MVGWNVVVLAIGAGILIGGLIVIGVAHMHQAAASVPEISAQAVPVAPIAAAVTASTPVPTDTPHSKFMYSTARGLKYRPVGWVCTEKNPTYIYNSQGEVGIWCATGYQS